MEQTLIYVGIIAAIIFSFGPIVYVCRKWLTMAQMLPVYIIVPLLALVLLSSCGSNPEDHTGENWLLLIGLMLCWLKG